MNWYRQIVNLLESTDPKYPDKISYYKLRYIVADIHHRYDDMYYGDLDNRLQKYDYYVLQSIPLNKLNMDQWSHDDDLSDKYAEMPKEDMPPIVYDSMAKSIIDGTHRAHAAKKRGDTEIMAYVGLKEFRYPQWRKKRG